MSQVNQTSPETEVLRELLKRCPKGTFEAALALRAHKDVEQVPTIVMGIIERHLEPNQKEILSKEEDSIRLYEDLGVDSLTMLEIVMMVEQTLQVTIDNEELRDLRTLADVKVYLDAKVKGEKPPERAKTYRIEEIASIMPQRDPFLFLESVTLDGESISATYHISGNEYFLEGHFKDNPIFPASIMIEALGQLGVFYLLKGKHASLESAVRPDSIFFASCDEVKCRRICKPGEVLEMRANIKRIRHPLAVFEGEITVGGEKTATAEEIKLTFDYYPLVQGASQEVLTKADISDSSNGNGNGTNGKDGHGNLPPQSRISTEKSSRDTDKTLAD
ncbi:MAG: phosphopantetheine-binding protein [Opitutales bacterium]